MKVAQGQNKNKERKNRNEKATARAKEKHGVRDVGETVSECESGVLTVTGALRLHDT